MVSSTGLNPLMHTKHRSGMRILAISGSLRAESTNTTLLRATGLVVPPDVEVVVYREMKAIPPFNPDNDIDPPPLAVSRFRAALRDSSAVIFSTPEYAHGVPGSLKNALDWVVESGELSRKPVSLMNASSRGVFEQASLREILRTMDAELLEEAEITLPLMGRDLTAPEIAADAEFSALILASLEKLSDAIANKAMRTHS